MKKVNVFLAIILCICIATSCSIVGDRLKMLNESNSIEKSKNTLEQILDSISSKDADRLKSLFSSQALNEVNDIDNDIEYLFEFFDGEVSAWEVRTGPVVNGSNTNGKRTKEIITWFNVDTDSNRYVVFILEYTVDTEQDENVGVYALRIVCEDDKDTQMTFWQDMVIPGIYRPDK